MNDRKPSIESLPVGWVMACGVPNCYALATHFRCEYAWVSPGDGFDWYLVRTPACPKHTLSFARRHGIQAPK